MGNDRDPRAPQPLGLTTRISRRPAAGGPRTAVTVTVLVVVSVVAAIVAALADPRPPTARDWYVVGVLAAVAVAGALISGRFAPPDDDSTPPWDPHTVWLLPAALLTPPAAFGALLALSVVLGMAKRAHSLTLRVVVACITVLTTAALHGAARLIDSFALASLAGVAALWLIGAVVAVAVAHVFVTPSGTATWLDYRWSLVLGGCALSGVLIAGAMRTDPILGFAAIAPLLLAAFALHWPELDRRASIDAKTGLPNTRHWEDRSRELLAAASMHEVPVTVMILDVDRFKEVNDSYGHLVGDRVLLAVADTVRSQVNPGDVVGRFGGDEFVVTMFELTSAEALTAAERIRAAVAAWDFGLPVSETADGDAAPTAITCTIGLASSGPFGYDLHRLLGLADGALATGKAAGRNRVRDAGRITAADPSADPSTGTDRADPGVVLPAGRLAGPPGDRLGTPTHIAPSWWQVASRQRAIRLHRRARAGAKR